MDSGNGQFDGAVAIAVGLDDSVYIADTKNNRIQKFDRNGTFIKTWGVRGNQEGQLL